MLQHHWQGKISYFENAYSCLFSYLRPAEIDVVVSFVIFENSFCVFLDYVATSKWILSQAHRSKVIMSHQLGCCQVHRVPLLEGCKICQDRWQDHRMCTECVITSAESVSTSFINWSPHNKILGSIPESRPFYVRSFHVLPVHTLSVFFPRSSTFLSNV